MTPKIPQFQIRKALSNEYDRIGNLMVEVYSELDGFPNPSEQPKYYQMLKHIGDFTIESHAELLVAVSPSGEIGGALVYFNDMKYYGSGGTATKETNASGFRLLAVDKKTRGLGIGKLLSLACIQKTKEDKNQTLIIHTTMAMQIAWKMYENLGFKRSEDLDFVQGELPVYGFRLLI